MQITNKMKEKDGIITNPKGLINMILKHKYIIINNFSWINLKLDQIDKLLRKWNCKNRQTK